MKKRKNRIEALVLLAIALITLLIIHKLSSFNTPESNWKVETVKENDEGKVVLVSPSFKINRLYKSMQGPASAYRFNVDTAEKSLLWLTGFGVKALNEEWEESGTEEAICHTNLDYDKEDHLAKGGGLFDSLTAYPRLFTLTQGQTSLQLPDGFGFPVFSAENLSVITQTLNHNALDSTFITAHEITLKYIRDRNLKPLTERTIFVMLPFTENREKRVDTATSSCLPVDPNDHRYLNSEGNLFTGHWVIPPGTNTYSSDVSNMLNLDSISSLHYAGLHTHPFAEQVILKDKTLDSVILELNCKNLKSRIGVKKLDYFSSQKGLLIDPKHEYELRVMVNNTSNENQDMMASLFLYFYDRKLHRQLKINGY